MIKKVSTGNSKLDKLLGGGFPEGGMILLAGNPGSGKTILSARFVYQEGGVYVCFAENADTFTRSMKELGMDFKALVEDGRAAILDLSIGTEIDVQRCLNLIMEKITSLHAKRVVIDSVTAMSIGLRSELDKRHLFHLLYNLLHKAGCTTIVITDIRWGSTKIGESIEEFVADGIILMQTDFDSEGRLRRQLRVLKMRGVDHTKRTHEYTVTDRGVEIREWAGE